MRKTLSRKTRFEVFKRDSFTCQYCGRKSPDVILEADHIEPIADGGSDDILNLTTACMDCNGGKGANPLSENVSIERKRRQLEMLQERREQLQMLYEWQKELSHLDEDAVEMIDGLLGERTKWRASEVGKSHLRHWIKTFGFEEVLPAFNEAFARYYKETQESWDEAFNRIPRVIKWKRMQKSDPEGAKYLYTLGIIRNRLNYVNYAEFHNLCHTWSSWGWPIETLQQIAMHSNSWTQFRNEVVETNNRLAEQRESEAVK